MALGFFLGLPQVCFCDMTQNLIGAIIAIHMLEPCCFMTAAQPAPKHDMWQSKMLAHIFPCGNQQSELLLSLAHSLPNLSGHLAGHPINLKVVWVESK